jgi:hypothetical protein
MSSLMQHHGAVRNGKLELLMYIQGLEPQKPTCCNHCGHPTPDENEWQCSKCNRPFWGRYRINPNQDGEFDRCLFTRREEAGVPYIDGLMSNDYAAAHVPLRFKHDSEPVKLTRPDGTVTTCAKLYRIWRKPVGMWGCWVVFRWNGEEHVPDLSVPIGVDKLPRDAEALTDDEAAKYWFS